MREDSPAGAEVDATEFTREDRKRYRDKVRKGLDVLARMLTESRFDFERPNGWSASSSTWWTWIVSRPCVMRAYRDCRSFTQITALNIEINVAPRRLAEAGFTFHGARGRRTTLIRVRRPSVRSW